MFAPSVSATFRGTIISDGLNETSEIPVMRINKTGISRIYAGTFPRVLLPTIITQAYAVPSVRFQGRIQS